MTASPTETPAATLSAAELRARIVRLAESLRIPEDTNAAHVREVMGVAFEWNPEWTQDEYHGTVREGWDYWISVSPDGSAPGSYIRLAFGERGLHGGACIYDLESLTADLSKAGFRRKVVLPPPLPRTWIFNKRVHETGIGFDIRARVDFLDVMADPRRECITDFSIGSGVIRHE